MQLGIPPVTIPFEEIYARELPLIPEIPSSPISFLQLLPDVIPSINRYSRYDDAQIADPGSEPEKHDCIVAKDFKAGSPKTADGIVPVK
jgi:hypothetical protein